MNSPTQYIVVKYATADVWHNFFDTDPKLGVCASHSAHDTWTGYQVGIFSLYTSHRAAKQACLKMNNANPACCYEVCPIAGG